MDEEEQIDIDAVVGLLEDKGPHLPYPHSSDVKGCQCGAIIVEIGEVLLENMNSRDREKYESELKENIHWGVRGRGPDFSWFRQG